MALNATASRAAVDLGASAATDITGYGLAGHACEMADASDVTIELSLQRLPLLPGARDLATAANFTRAVAGNREFTIERTALAAGAAESDLLPFMYDPQTSGGLLVAVPAAAAGEFVQRCRGGGAGMATVVGQVQPADGKRLRISL